MKPIEVTGRNIDEIRTEAAKQLGVPEDQVKLEVVEEKRALLGFLGGGMVALASVADADADDAPADEPPPEADVSPDEP
ncbi:MAG TPA: Jag N-terminal domain-containing protein, partial [Armatimonadota bacterium]|nr:Jag N-terminal domain-containing protein [Armatimonadota bacterium]